MISEFSKHINFCFDRVAYELNMGTAEIYDLSGMSKRNNFSSLSLVEMESVLSHLNINLEMLVNNKACIKTIRKYLSGDQKAIPEKWIGNRGTKMSTISAALSLIPKDSRDRVLKKYQLTLETLNDNSQEVSAELLKNIFQDLQDFNYTENVDFVGHKNCKNYLTSSKGLELAQFKDLESAIVHMLEHQTTDIEKNMNYKVLKSNSNRVLFEYVSKDSLKEFFKTNHFGNFHFCNNIRGFVEELGRIKLNHRVKVNKLSCAHFGDTSCTYEVLLNDFITH